MTPSPVLLSSLYSPVIGLKGQRTCETRFSHVAACLLPCLCSSLAEYLYSFSWPFLDQNTDSKVGNGVWGVSMYFVSPSQPRRSGVTGWMRTLLNGQEWTRIQCVSCLLWSAAGWARSSWWVNEEQTTADWCGDMNGFQELLHRLTVS